MILLCQPRRMARFIYQSRWGGWRLDRAIIVVFFTLLFCLSGTLGLQRMVQLPTNPQRSERSNGNISVDIDFFQRPHAAAPAAFNLCQNLNTTPTTFPLGYTAAALGAPQPIQSLRVNRAEGGLVMSFFADQDDKVPVFAVSFVIDIHEPLVVPTLDHDYRTGNVEVQIKNPEKVGTAIHKIEFFKPFPQILVL